jgi:hypothetical protein
MEHELTVYAGVLALVLFAIVTVILCVASSKKLKTAWQPLAKNVKSVGTKQDHIERAKSGIILQTEGIKPDGSGDVTIDASVLVGEAHSAYTTAKQETDLLLAYERVTGAIACLQAIQRVANLTQIAAFLPPAIGGVSGLLDKLEVQKTGLLQELRSKGPPPQTPTEESSPAQVPLWVPFKREQKHADSPTPETPPSSISPPRHGFAVTNDSSSRARSQKKRTGSIYPTRRRSGS